MNFIIKRLFAFFIDSFVSFWLTLLVITIIHYLNIGVIGYEIRYIQIPVLLIYIFVSEFLFSQTIGKKLMKLKVVCESKHRLKYFFIRTLSRLIPFEPFSIFLDKDKLMWHDKLSTTKVISLP